MLLVEGHYDDDARPLVGCSPAQPWVMTLTSPLLCPDSDADDDGDADDDNDDAAAYAADNDHDSPPLPSTSPS
eukprot:2825196-Karenia_brevis.AAC.1